MKSTYLTLSPVQGLLAGFFSGMLMFIFLIILTYPISIEIFLSSGYLLLLLSTHLIGSSVLGLLYALCQQDAPNNMLISVGLFYGFFIWIIGHLFRYTLLIPEFISSSHWLWGCLLYGFILSIWSILAPNQSKKIIIDQRVH